MISRALFATAPLVALLIVSPIAAAEESVPVHQQDVSDAASNSDMAAAPVEARAVPDNLQAARKADESPFGDIKILPSF